MCEIAERQHEPRALGGEQLGGPAQAPAEAGEVVLVVPGGAPLRVERDVDVGEHAGSHSVIDSLA